MRLKGEVTPEKLIEAVEKAGYGATLRSADEARQRKADEEREAARLAEERQTLLRFAVSALLSLALVVGTLPMMMGTGHAWIGPWTQAALAAGVMLASGTRFYREAFNAVRGGGANMAVLVSLGTSVAFFASLAEVIRGNAHAHLYFEAAAVVLTLVMLGKYLEARAKRGAGAALAALGKLQPAEAELVSADGTRTVPAGTLRKGDVVLVRPGGRFPSDGVILSGRSSVDEALVTGESLPVERGEGDPVLTGTINGEAALEVTVTEVGADTRLARMARLVEEAQTGDAPIQRLVDRISAIFVPVILVVAAATFLVWWLALGDPAGGLGRDCRRARHRLPLRARAGDADRARRRNRFGRPGRHPDPRYRNAGAGGPDRRRRFRQDRHADAWPAVGCSRGRTRRRCRPGAASRGSDRGEERTSVGQGAGCSRRGVRHRAAGGARRARDLRPGADRQSSRVKPWPSATSGWQRALA